MYLIRAQYALHALIQSHFLEALNRILRVVSAGLAASQHACWKLQRGWLLYRGLGHGLLRPKKAAWSSPWLNAMLMQVVMCGDMSPR